MLRRATWTLALWLLTAGPVQASEDASGGLSDLLWSSFNLAILLGVLIYFGRRPIQAFFANRRQEIQRELKDSANQLAEAEATYAEWQRRLIGLESELEEIRTISRQRAESERERILSDARASADRIRRDATSAVEQELRRAREELRDEAAQLALELAARRLEREVGDVDRDRLVDEFIDRVESGAPARPEGH